MLPGLDQGRHYEHAPIVQAILELRVMTPDDLIMEDLEALNFGQDYADPTTLYHLQGQLTFSEEGSVASEPQRDHVGFGFAREDGTRVIQVGLRRFAFIWSGEYTHWGEFSTEAEAAWLAYKGAARVVSVERVGVRFVNQIRLPEGHVEIKDYLRTSVDISAYLPQAVSSMFFQVEIPIVELDAGATVTSALMSEGDSQALLLDIDVKTSTVLSTEDEAFDVGVRGTLDRLRFAKNYVFEACITDATRGLIG